ncbi:hypothetical protein [Sphingorhabdus sp.]|uniref:hypothetical protein n=1 Tax=Sphingorhabdus sp. TaxID=1902408 RepID=UPI00391990FE
MRKLTNFVHNLCTNERGNILIHMGLSSPLFVRLARLGVGTNQITQLAQQPRQMASFPALNHADATLQAGTGRANAIMSLINAFNAFTGSSNNLESADGGSVGNGKSIYRSTKAFPSKVAHKIPSIKVENFAIFAGIIFVEKL